MVVERDRKSIRSAQPAYAQAERNTRLVRGVLAAARRIVADEHQVGIGAFLGSELVAFVELSLHPHAVGRKTGPVAYLEAWYVKAEHRRQRIGHQLVKAGYEWARAQGCREIASDTWLDHTVGHSAHLALGFTEASRLIHYRTPL